MWIVGASTLNFGAAEEFMQYKRCLLLFVYIQLCGAAVGEGDKWEA